MIFTSVWMQTHRPWDWSHYTLEQLDDPAFRDELRLLREWTLQENARRRAEERSADLWDAMLGEPA